MWILKEGRLARQRVQLGERLLDGRVQIIPDAAAGQFVIDDRTDLREGRSARALQSL